MEDSSADRNTVEVLAEEFVDRYRRGERPPLSEYTIQFPDLAEEIRDLFPAMLMMENLKPVEERAAATDNGSRLELEQLGDYRIIREVGRGGMGIVYEAEQVSLGRHVALKVLPKEMVAKPEHRLRFEREAKAAAKLHHTNIVPVFGVGDTDGQLYYVMQFIQGLALDDVLEELKRLRAAASGSIQPPPETSGVSGRDASVLELAQTFLIGSRDQIEPTDQKSVSVNARPDSPETEPHLTIVDMRSQSSTSNSSVVLPRRSPESGEAASRQTTYFESIAQIGVQVARALDYAHSQGILHRDIKPANLLLDLKGTVWVTDFGLAKLEDERGLTQAGDIIGTLRYMAPESFKGQYDNRSEVYCLGLTLYEMLAFRPAFTESSRNALIDHVMQSQIETLATLNPKVPSDLQTVIHKAIDRAPEHRYQSAADLADDLHRFLNDEPIKARRVSLLERLNRWSRRHKSLATALATVMLLVSLLAAGSTIAAGYFRSVSGTLETTVTNLKTAQASLNDKVKTLNSLTEQLTASKNEEVKKSAEADSARRAAQTMLADMQTERGLMAAEQGDPATATLWFAHAADQTDHDPQRQAANRLRARNALDQSVLPVALLPQEVPGEPRRLIFRPQGDLLLSLQGNRLQIWNWEREQSQSWSDELKRVNDAIWSPDGQRIAIGLATGELQIRSMSSGNVDHQFLASKPIESMAWSSDGRRLAVAGQTVQIWNVSANPVLEYVCDHPNQVYSVLFNRDGTRLVTGCRDRQARVFVLSGRQTLLSAAFSPLPHAPVYASSPVFVDGDRGLITLPNPDRIGWWNAATGADAAPASAQLDTYFSRRLAVSDDGQRFAVAADPPIVWNISGNRQSLKHVNHVPCVAFGPKGTTVATACNDWMARVWSIADPIQPPSIVPPMVIPQLEGVLQCAFTTDGSYLAVCGVEQIRVWKLPEQSRVIAGHAGWSQQCLQPRPGFDGHWITPGRWHEAPSAFNPLSSLTVAETATGKPAGPAIRIDRIVDSCLCADNRSVAIASATETAGKLSIFDVVSGRESFAFTLPGAPCSVTARAGTPDVAVLCQTGQIIIVNQLQGTVRFEIATESANYDVWHARVRYSPDGQRLIHLTAQNEIAVYDATSGWSCFPNICPLLSEGACRTLTISNDSRWLATGVNGKNAVQIWDLSTGIAASDPLPHPGDYFGIFSIAFSPDGRWILSGNKDGRARLWNWQTGQQICPPLQHTDEVMCVAFTADGQHALTGARSGTLRIWELTTGKIISPPVQYPLFPQGSTATLAVVNDLVIVSGRDYPIIRLDPLLAESSLSTEFMQSMARLATGRRLELGELSGLSATQWSELWGQLRGRELAPQTLAQSFAREIDRAVDARSRMTIAERAAKSPTVFAELLCLRRDIPELHVMLAKVNEKQDFGLAARAIEQAIATYEQQLAARFDEALPEGDQGENVDQVPRNGAAVDKRAVTQIAEDLARLLLSTKASQWRNLEFSTATSRSGAVFARRNDGAFLVSDKNTAADVYTLTAIDGGKNVSAIRLDVLTDLKLPNQGPGRHPSGNFQLSAFRLLRPPMIEGQPSQFVSLSAAYASYSYSAPDVDVRGTIKEGSKLGWHVWSATGQPHHAVFVLEQPVAIDRQHPMIIELHHRDVGTAVNLGCFRLSASADAQAFDRDVDLRNIQSGVYPEATVLAATYMLLDRYEKANQLLEQLAKLNDTASEPIRVMLLSDCNQRLNQNRAARKYYDKLLAWLSIDRLPDSLEQRVIDLMQTVGGLSATQAKANYQRLRIEVELRLLTEQIERQPNSRNLYINRATLYTGLGQWNQAAADHLRTTELTPDDRLTWMRAAALLVMANDRAGYKKLCQRLLSQFPKTTVPILAESVCKTSLLLPDIIPLADLPTATLAQSLDDNSPFIAWIRSSCALVALREGRFQRVIELSQRLGDSSKDLPDAMMLICRSMAQYHLQDPAAAIRSLQQADAIIPEILRTAGTSQQSTTAVYDSDVVTHDWLIVEILRREAASLVH